MTEVEVIGEFHFSRGEWFSCTYCYARQHYTWLWVAGGHE